VWIYAHVKNIGIRDAGIAGQTAGLIIAGKIRKLCRNICQQAIPFRAHDQVKCLRRQNSRLPVAKKK
jgi:hypothetical protein